MADVLDTPIGPTSASSNTSEVICSISSPTTSLPASSVTRRGKASISSLPVELLTIIFGEIYRACMVEGSRCPWNPLTLGSVCPFWKVALYLTPDIWTQFNVFLDVPFFSAAFVASILVKSHNLVMEKVTFSRSIWTPIHDEHERERVMMVMEAIAPHLHRCRSITFLVRFSSSLPSFPGDFRGNAKHLTSLRLKCLEDDGGAVSNETSLSPVHREPFQCPNLRTLSIDGRNYFNACRQNINWTEAFPLIQSISISHFTPVAIRSESFTMSELRLSLFPFRNHLSYFSINDVHLEESPTPIPTIWNLDELDDDEVDDHFSFIQLKTVVVQNIYNARCVQQILATLGGSRNMHISRCRLASWSNCDDNLSLRKIERGEDIVAFLKGCLAKKLAVDDCPGFGDKVLNAMIVPKSRAWFHEGSSLFCVEELQYLSIHDCPNFSISTLKQVLETRRIASESTPHNMHDLPIPRICALRLSGRVPDVSPEDRDWFKSCVSVFSYHPGQ